MHSTPPDAPIPLESVDQESLLRRGDEEEDTKPDRSQEGERETLPTYPPTPSLPRGKGRLSNTSRGGRVGGTRSLRRTRAGSTLAVPGFGTRSRASTRHALYLLLERPTSSSSAFVLHLVTNAVIVLRYGCHPRLGLAY